jgi:glycosyltransferase involved in cell wall biosynthesis
MTIAFIHSQTSFLPELEAYHAFFRSRGVQCESFHKPQWKKNEKKFDVEWHMLGTDMLQKTCPIRIHEYASASTPPFGPIKNKLKKFINTKPDYRIFLNQYVHSSFNFKDELPFGYRDMGVDDLPPLPRNNRPSIDFIYVGALDQHRNIENLLQKFTTGDLLQRTILILGKDYENLRSKFSTYPNIQFEGPVPHEAVRAYLHRAAYAINFIPDREPFNRQTSTKLLEYVQQQLPVVTTDYPWMREFEKERGGRYFYLDSSLVNFRWENIRQFQYAHADLSDMNWEAQILKSGIWDFLQKKGNDALGR